MEEENKVNISDYENKNNSKPIKVESKNGKANATIDVQWIDKSNGNLDDLFVDSLYAAGADDEYIDQLNGEIMNAENRIESYKAAVDANDNKQKIKKELDTNDENDADSYKASQEDVEEINQDYSYQNTIFENDLESQAEDDDGPEDDEDFDEGEDSEEKQDPEEDENTDGDENSADEEKLEGDENPVDGEKSDGDENPVDGEKPEGNEKPDGDEKPADEEKPDGDEKPADEEKPDGDEKPADDEKPDGDEKPEENKDSGDGESKDDNDSYKAKKDNGEGVVGGGQQDSQKQQNGAAGQKDGSKERVDKAKKDQAASNNNNNNKDGKQDNTSKEDGKQGDDKKKNDKKEDDKKEEDQNKGNKKNLKNPIQRIKEKGREAIKRGEFGSKDALKYAAVAPGEYLKNVMKALIKKFIKTHPFASIMILIGSIFAGFLIICVLGCVSTAGGGQALTSINKFDYDTFIVYINDKDNYTMSNYLIGSAYLEFYYRHDLQKLKKEGFNEEKFINLFTAYLLYTKVTVLKNGGFDDDKNDYEGIVNYNKTSDYPAMCDSALGCKVVSGRYEAYSRDTEMDSKDNNKLKGLLTFAKYEDENAEEKVETIEYLCSKYIMNAVNNVSGYIIAPADTNSLIKSIDSSYGVPSLDSDGKVKYLIDQAKQGKTLEEIINNFAYEYSNIESDEQDDTKKPNIVKLYNPSDYTTE